MAGRTTPFLLIPPPTHSVMGFSKYYVWGGWVKFCPWTKFMPCSVLMFRVNTDLCVLCVLELNCCNIRIQKLKKIHIQCIWMFSLSTPNSTLMPLVYNVDKKYILHNVSVQKLKTTVNYSSHSFSPFLLQTINSKQFAVRTETSPFQRTSAFQTPMLHLRTSFYSQCSFHQSGQHHRRDRTSFHLKEMCLQGLRFL